MNTVYLLILFILKILKFAVWFLIFTVIFGALSPYISHLSSYPFLHPFLDLAKGIHTGIKYFIPTKIAGWDLWALISVIILLFISATISNFIFSLQKAKMRASLREFESKPMTAQQQTLVRKMEETIEDSGKNKEKTRQELLKEFAQLKKELEKTGRDLSFLAIDVVDSTNMKLGEEPVIVEHDFNQYHDFITRKFTENGYIKAAWTPDGVMACFNTTQQAIAAAKDIILSLPDFNKSIKMMKRDFHIRCGINSGFVYYDLSTPLEEFSDRVIDIAGHMQKHADVDTVQIAKHIVKPIESYQIFESTKNIVDGFEVCEWRSQSKET